MAHGAQDALERTKKHMSKDPDVARITYWIRLLRERNAFPVVRDFSPDLRAAMPMALLQLSWDALIRQVGTFERVLSSETQAMGTDRLVCVRCAFSQSVREVMLGLRLDQKDRIRGFFGYRLTHNTALTNSRFPPYVNPDYFTEHDVAIGQEPWVVGGTLSRPVWDGSFPAVVLINTHGSRNGTVNKLRDLAWGLATQGIMVLRYDHTLVAHPKRDPRRGIIENRTAPPMTVEDDFLDNALFALRLLQSDPSGNGNLFAVGHGLGAYLLPRLARSYCGPLGLVSLFGHFRPPWEVISEDVARSQATVSSPEFRKTAARLQDDLDRIRQRHYRDDERLAGMSGRYWTDLFEHHGGYHIDPRTPIMVVHGEGDNTGGGIDEFNRLTTALTGHSRPTFALYPGLSYWLKPIEPGYDPYRNQRYTMQNPVDQRVIADLARWIRTLPPLG